MNTTIVERMLRKYGRDCDIITYTTSGQTNAPWRETALDETRSTKGLFLREYAETGPDVPSGSRFLLINGEVAPSLKAQVKVDSVLWKIHRFKAISVGETTLAYILTVTR